MAGDPFFTAPTGHPTVARARGGTHAHSHFLFLCRSGEKKRSQFGWPLLTSLARFIRGDSSPKFQSQSRQLSPYLKICALASPLRYRVWID